jgi:predicted metal-dependent phosphoesterase TrpH
MGRLLRTADRRRARGQIPRTCRRLRYLPRHARAADARRGALARILKLFAGMLKVELHTHTSDDPVDRIPHTVTQLIDRAAFLGYHALAITLHERQLDVRPFAGYAADRGIVLIPGIERSIEGRHTLLLNFRSGAQDVRSFDDLARLKRRQSGLVIAPHPFFPMPTCLGDKLDRHAWLFDAVERNAMYTSSLDFNTRAERWAMEHGKHVVGNCDVHRLYQLGTTYSMVDAEPNADSICASIAEGRVWVESKPLTWAQAARTLGSMFMSDAVSWCMAPPGRDWMRPSEARLSSAARSSIARNPR